MADADWPRYTELPIGKGVGLFPYASERQIAERLMECLSREANKMSGIGRAQIGSDLLLNELQMIASRYKYTKKVDEGLTYGQLKTHCKLLKVAVERVNQILSGFTPEAGEVINFAYCDSRQLRPLEKGETYAPGELGAFYESAQYVDFYSIAQSSLEKMEVACQEILKIKASKPQGLAVKRASQELWRLWERLCGRPFERRYDTHPVRSDERNHTHEFVGRDAHLVHTLLRRIDPDITHSQALSGLRHAARNVKMPT